MRCLEVSTRRGLGFFLLAAITLLASPAQAAPMFMGLGDLTGGNFHSIANAVSADGSTVVGESHGESGYEAFRWTGGVMTGLGELPGGLTVSTANDVSADGSTVVGASYNASGEEAFVWNDGVMTGLGELSGGLYLSHANGVSADGATVVGYSHGTSGYEAFRWTGGVMTGLGDFSGGNFASYAWGVSGDGATVVGYGTVTSGSRAFRWTGGVMTGLGGGVASAIYLGRIDDRRLQRDGRVSLEGRRSDTSRPLPGCERPGVGLRRLRRGLDRGGFRRPVRQSLSGRGRLLGRRERHP